MKTPLATQAAAQAAVAVWQPIMHAGIATGAGTSKIQPVKVQMRRRDFILQY